MSTVGEMIASLHFRDAISRAAEDSRAYGQTDIGRATRNLRSAIENACMLEAMDHVRLSKQEAAWDRVDECERTLRSVIDVAIREARGGK